MLRLTLHAFCFKCEIRRPFLAFVASEEDILKGKQSIRSQALGNQNSESETSLDGDDDTLSSLEEKDLENLTGKEAAHLPLPITAILIDLNELCYMQNDCSASFSSHLDLTPVRLRHFLL